MALESTLQRIPDSTVRGLYRSYVDRLGPTILVNGLGQALAGELAAATSDHGKAHRILADHVASWLSDPADGIAELRGGGSAAPVLQALCDAPQRSYIRAQAEALAWLSWHKRFTRSRIEAPDGSDSL